MSEFIDRKDHPKMVEFYELIESTEITPDNWNKVEEILKSFIREDPDFYDPYTTIFEINRAKKLEEKATDILKTGYERAVNYVLKESQGEWPDKLKWSWMENRHIIRVILNWGTRAWELGGWSDAEQALQKLVLSDPEDRPGVRYYLLAVKMNMSYQDFMSRFDKGGYYDAEAEAWFRKHAIEYPGDFKQVLALIENE
ncbi:MAG: tetratricopeptide repeat protein [Spirochaetia bacterium]